MYLKELLLLEIYILISKSIYSWPLNNEFFEVAQEPVDWKYQVYVKARNEYKNFKRYILKPSIETTLLSSRSSLTSCPVPESIAYTLFAPLLSKQSVKPPVDAPMSAHILPHGFEIHKFIIYLIEMTFYIFFLKTKLILKHIYHFLGMIYCLHEFL